MGDAVELVPVSELHERVFESWSSGKSLRAVSREFGIPLSETERIIDRALPQFDAPHQIRAFKRELERLENLASEFYTIAKRDKDAEAGHLAARLNERLCAMRGWTSVNIKLDPMSAQLAEKPKSYDLIREAVFRIAGRSPPPLAASGNGAASAPSPEDEGFPD
jgi:hypothetical protein